MTEDFQVQQRPSAVPYALGGAAVGAGAGWGLHAAGLNPIKPQAFDSWEKAVEAANKDDAFIKEAVKSSDSDIQSAAKNVTEKAKAIKDANDAYEKALKDIDALKNVNTEKLNVYLDKVQAKADVEANKVGELIDGAKEALDTKFKFPGAAGAAEEEKTIIDVIKGIDSNFAGTDKKAVEDWLADATNGAARKTNLENALKGAKEYTEAVKAADDAITEAAKEVKINNEAVDKLGEKVTDSLKNARKSVLEKTKDAEKNITDDVLKHLKKPNLWAALGIMGAVGLLAGLLIRPKAKEV